MAKEAEKEPVPPSGETDTSVGGTDEVAVGHQQRAAFSHSLRLAKSKRSAADGPPRKFRASRPRSSHDRGPARGNYGAYGVP
jgi:hypothetical protein